MKRWGGFPSFPTSWDEPHAGNCIQYIHVLEALPSSVNDRGWGAPGVTFASGMPKDGKREACAAGKAHYGVPCP